MSTNYIIEHGVPIEKPFGGIAAIIQDMKVGDSVVLPREKVFAWVSAAKRCGRKVSFRKISPTERRVWIVEEKSKASV